MRPPSGPAAARARDGCPFAFPVGHRAAQGWAQVGQRLGRCGRTERQAPGIASPPFLPPRPAPSREDVCAWPSNFPRCRTRRTRWRPTSAQETLEYHYGKHHQTYVDQPQQAHRGHRPDADKSLEDVIARGRRAGCSTTRPRSGTTPSTGTACRPAAAASPPASWASKINSAFGSYDEFRTQFAEAATTQFGSGWAWLADDGSGLQIMKTANADLPLKHGGQGAAHHRRVGARLLHRLPQRPAEVHRRRSSTASSTGTSSPATPPERLVPAVPAGGTVPASTRPPWRAGRRRTGWRPAWHGQRRAVAGSSSTAVNDVCGDAPTWVCRTAYDWTGSDSWADVVDWVVAKPLTILVIVVAALVVNRHRPPGDRQGSCDRVTSTPPSGARPTAAGVPPLAAHEPPLEPSAREARAQTLGTVLRSHRLHRRVDRRRVRRSSACST